MKSVIYITQSYFLDEALEYVILLSKKYKVYFIIELSNESMRANVLNLNIELKNYNTLTSYDEVVSKWGIDYLSDYFKHCEQAVFFVCKNKRSISLQTIKENSELISFIKKVKPDYIHLDDFSVRQFPLLPFIFLNKDKSILNIHDPKPHLGESDWKREVVKKLLYLCFGKFVVFSRYSKELLREVVPSTKKIYFLKLLPYNVFKSFKMKKSEVDKKKISIIGRISPYKGIELGILVFNEISKKYPEQNFVIAGNPILGYDITEEKVKYIPNLEIIKKHLNNEEIVSIIQESKVVFCPYIEATQSGIIMTAYALNTPVVVTDVGGLPEYIYSNTGLASKADVTSLVKCLEKFITNQHLDVIRATEINNIVYSMHIQHNLHVIKEIYN